MSAVVLNSIAALAKRLAVEAGKQALTAFQGQLVASSLKKDRTVVTDYDIRIESWLREKILAVYQDHGIFGEEAGMQEGSSDYVWYLDPIDGTTNFSMGNPMFGTMIAVTHNDVPVVSAVYQPVTGTLAVASVGNGMDMAGKNYTASLTPLDTGTVYIERGRISGALDRHARFISREHATFRGWRRFGTMVGASNSMRSGSFTGLIVFGAPKHDLIANALLCQEAGYMVTDFTGKPWSIGASDLLVCHADNHQQLVHLLEEYTS